MLIGLDFISVRRLHASTERQPDPQRPLPVIIGRANERAIPTLKSWRLYDVLNIAPGADREVVAPLVVSGWIVNIRYTYVFPKVAEIDYEFLSLICGFGLTPV